MSYGGRWCRNERRLLASPPTSARARARGCGGSNRRVAAGAPLPRARGRALCSPLAAMLAHAAFFIGGIAASGRARQWRTPRTAGRGLALRRARQDARRRARRQGLVVLLGGGRAEGPACPRQGRVLSEPEDRPQRVGLLKTDGFGRGRWGSQHALSGRGTRFLA